MDEHGENKRPILIPSGKLLQFTMENPPIFNGKTHYFYGHFQ